MAKVRGLFVANSVQISHGYLIIHVAFFFAVMNFVMPTAVLTVVLVYNGSQ
jgi:hypothetical protein